MKDTTPPSVKELHGNVVEANWIMMECDSDINDDIAHAESDVAYAESDVAYAESMTL